MLAGLDFRKLIDELPDEMKARANRLEAKLYGSLSATGAGHGTDRAVLTGLMGYAPAFCPDTLPGGFFELPEDARTVRFFGHDLSLGRSNVIFDSIEHNYPYSNTMQCRLLDAEGQELCSRL